MKTKNALIHAMFNKTVVKTLTLILFVLNFNAIYADHELPTGSIVNRFNKLKIQEYKSTQHAFVLQLYCVDNNDQDDSWSDDDIDEPHILKINGNAVVKLRFTTSGADGRLDLPNSWFATGINKSTLGDGSGVGIVLVLEIPDTYFQSGQNNITFEGVWKERIDGTNDSWTMEYLTVTQNFPRPGTATSLSASFDQYGNVNMTWSPPIMGDYDSLVTYRNTMPLNYYDENTTSAVDNSYHYNDNLGVQYLYKWTDNIIDNGSVVLESSIVYTQPGDPPSPSTPSNVQATQNRCDSIILISWDYNDNDVTEPYFRVYRNGFDVSGLLQSSEHSFEDHVGGEYLQYNYTVKAFAPYNSTVSSQSEYWPFESSPLSNSVVGKTYGLPSAPTGLSATVNTNSIVLNWTPGTMGQEEIYINKVSANNTVKIEGIQAGQNTYTDSNVPGCVTLNYTICVKNSCTEQPITSNTVTARITPVLTNTFDNSHRLICSKGYYNDKITLRWQFNNVSNISRFKIYRREVTSTDTLLIATISPTSSYEDFTADPGVYYEYYIVGEYDCENDILKTPINVYAKDFGFRSQFATVSGNVSYEAGNGVKNVTVVAETQDQFPSNSLMFNNSNSYIRIPHKNFDFSENFAFSAWVKPNSSTQQVVYQKGAQYKVYHQLNNILFTAGTQSIYLNFPEKVDTFFNITVMRDPDSLYIYVIYDRNTVYKTSAARLSSTPANNNDIYIGDNLNAFTGWIDDIRIWEKSFDEESLVNNVIRYLFGNENGLRVYYHLDESYDYKVFDISRNGSYFNENHGYINNCQLSPIVPLTRQQLGTKGITDNSGNYIISNIPYTVGSVYIITPMYELHEFDPLQRQLFIGPGANNHSNIDFTDIAAFKISGTVKYYGTDFPVKDVNLYIDGDIVVREDGSFVKTDEYGRYEIYVPIGWHNISVGKTCHVFVDNGLFPANGNYNFDQPITGIDFYDSTLVKVIGRCAGGPIEQEKKSGMGRTVNNIGNASILLTTQRNYPLTEDANGVNGIWNNGYYQNDQLYNYGSTAYNISAFNPEYITIYPDTQTGEFVAYLLPEKYIINNITAGEYTYDNSYLTTLDLTNACMQMTEIDSIVTGFYIAISGDTAFEYQIDSVNYQYNLDLILRIHPTVDVTDISGNQFFGEETYVTRTGDTLSLVNIDGTLKTLYPVFLQRKEYNLIISVFENYHNQDNGQYDTVPVKDGKVEIINNLAINRNKEVYQIDDNGKVTYSFKGGLPNITQGGIGDYLLTMSIVSKTGQNGSILTEWLPNNEPFKGYLLGGLATGNNFVTTGPNKLITILRDPPGTDSYSFLEQGSEIVYSESNEAVSDLIVNNNVTVDFGSKVTSFQGLGAGTIQEIEYIANASTGFDMTNTYIDNNTTTTSVSTTQRWQTSQGQDFVGSGGDIFIGYSTNIVYGISRQIDILPVNMLNAQDFVGHQFSDNNVTYDIGKINGIRINPEFNTAFQYSLNHIENYLLPNLKMLRNKFLLQDTAVYHTILPPSDPEFGRDNTTGYFDGTSWVGGDSYNYTLPANWPSDSLFVDSVAFFNQQIKNWLDILAENEKEKLYATFEKNISFDAGAIYDEEQTNSQSDETISTYSFTMSPYISSEVGQSVLSIGTTMTLERRKSSTKTHTDGTTETQSITYGYHLEDNNAGDYISIDVKKPNSNNGPVFITRGGQTMCPYEDLQVSQYFNPGTVISQATMQREIPEIDALNSILNNIPEDQPAEFVLSLKNTSQSNDDQWFILSVDEQSNQNGAQLYLDGTPIDNGRLILIPAGQSITKVLSLYKGLANVYDYEDIGIILHSSCQFDPTDFQADISDTVFISAYFNPVCSSVSLTNPEENWIINTATDTTLDCIITGYDLNSTTFNKILLQYKPASASSWITDMVFYVDENEYNMAQPPKYFINDQASLNYSIDFHSLQDRFYLIKATSMCTDGTTNTSSIISGIKDVKPPLVFGAPQPADGILSPGDEISITFDETINSNALLPFNFSVRGAINSTELKHNACLYFDGVDDYASIESEFNLDNKSWTIEFWLRRGDLNECVIYSHGDIEIGLNVNRKFYVKLGSQTFTSQTTISNTTDWNHFAISYNYDNSTLSMYINDNVEYDNAALNTPFTGNGRFYIGKSKNNSKYFNGFIHELRIWEQNIGLGTIYANMYQNLIGNEFYLIGYWPMSEANGDVANDKARYHHLILFGPQWKVFPSGYAYAFNTNSYINIPTGGSVVIDELNDFTLEFYFKCPPQTNSVMFSNGSGDGTDISPKYSSIWNIGFGNDGKLYVKNNGVILKLDSNYADNKWHHFALVCARQTNTLIYIDGEMQKSENSSIFGGLMGYEMTIGAKRQNLNNNVNYSEYFTGSVDEFRIWGLAKKQEQIVMDMNSKIDPATIGLLAYYPFDEYDNLGVQLLPSYINWANDTLLFTQFGGDFDNIDVPNIKEARPLQELNYNWVVNNDKIIISLNEPLATIEKSNIDITVERVKDMNDNFMPSPVTWSAYINQNSLIWEDEFLDLEKDVYNQLSFNEKIINNGGTQQNYEISNIPDWLSVDYPTGNINPNSYTQVTFTVDPSINVGNYEATVYLTGYYGYAEKLNIRLKVYKTPPQWSVNASNYQYNMNIIGQIKINGKFSTNPDDMIAAFVNNQCRGVAKSIYVEQYDNYQVYMTIYSNNLYGEHITFKVWNASEGFIHTDVTPELDFIFNQTIGTPSNPQVFEANNNYLFENPLFSGWNWVSFGLVNNQLQDINNIMSSVNNNSGDQIKTMSSFANYSALYGWNGPLMNVGFDNINMYMLKISQNDTLIYTGSPIDLANTQIPVNTGWNWISYLPMFNLSVNDALSNYQAADGDIVKSQYNFAMYDQILGWIGNLQYMQPGKGYMFYTSNPSGYLTYPTSGYKNVTNINLNNTNDNIPWNYDVHRYSENMSIVSILLKPSYVSDNNAIGAFIDGECRGVTKPTNINMNQYYFITTSSDDTGQISFKLIDFENGEIYSIKEHLQYNSNNIIGDPGNPFVMTLDSDTLNNYDNIAFNVFPNPFNDKLKINAYLPSKTNINLKLYDVVGKLIYSKSIENVVNGYNVFDVDISKIDLQQGVYNLKFETDTYSKVVKLIKE
ncbi:MAG: hypothetical protein Kow0068_03960 [Marinilabiliales bacterium]